MKSIRTTTTIRTIRTSFCFLVLFLGIFGLSPHQFRPILVRTKIIFFTLFLLIGVGMYAQNSEAKNLYVATNGSDSVAYVSNDISHPWLTPQHAWDTAQAGDVVNFREGRYDIISLIDTNHSGNSGTNSAWITFQSYPGEMATIKANSDMLVMVEIKNSYSQILDMTFDGNNHAPQIFGVGWYNGLATLVTGFRADHLTVSNWKAGDNACAFYIGAGAGTMLATNIYVTNCHLAGNMSTAQNYSAIMTFSAEDYHIENNEITATVRGIVAKHPSRNNRNTGCTIKYNWIHDQVLQQPGGYHMSGLAISDNYVTVEHNISDFGLHMGEDGGHDSGVPTGAYNLINHNTLLYSGISIEPDAGAYLCANNTMTNNICAARVNAGTNQTWHHNMYISGAAINSGGTGDLGNTSPTFVGGSNPTTIAGYALASGAGIDAASDGTDMGADVSLVGPDASEEEDITPPSAPSGLSVE